MSALPAYPSFEPTLIEAEPPRIIDLAGVWHDLISRRFRVSGYGYTEGHCSLVLTPVGQIVPKRFSARQCLVTERLLLGAPQKVVALEFGLAPSTVAIAFAKFVRSLGTPCRMQSVPMPVAMAVHAARGTPRLRSARESLRVEAGRLHRFIECERPDLGLVPLLPREQLAVVRLLLEGKSHREMAALRRRSVRTIANQLRQIYATLGVCGRSGIIAWLLTSSGASATDHSL